MPVINCRAQLQQDREDKNIYICTWHRLASHSALSQLPPARRPEVPPTASQRGGRTSSSQPSCGRGNRQPSGCLQVRASALLFSAKFFFLEVVLGELGQGVALILDIGYNM